MACRIYKIIITNILINIFFKKVIFLIFLLLILLKKIFFLIFFLNLLIFLEDDLRRDSYLIEYQRLKSDYDLLKMKLLSKDEELQIKSDENRKNEFLINKLRTEKISDMNYFCHQILGYIETKLIEMQRQEAIYINEKIYF